MATSAKVLISHDADQCLEQMVKTVNDGFDSGRVKKAELASWVLIQFARKWLAKELERIRADHFDEVAHLEAVIRRVKEARESEKKIELSGLLAPVISRQRSQGSVNGKEFDPKARAESSEIP